MSADLLRRTRSVVLDGIESNRPIVLSMAVFALAMAVRLTLLVVLRAYATSLKVEPVLVAASLVRDHVFGDVFGGHTGPTASLAPGYPFVLALIYGCFGFGMRGEIIRKVLSIAACSVQYALLPKLAASCGIRPSVGFLAGVAGALVPTFFWLETDGCFEPAYIGAMLVGMLVLSARVFRGERISPYLYGAAWGLVFLFAPTFVTIFAGLLALLWWEKRNTIVILRIVVAAGLVVSPWIARNYYHFGTFFWIRNNLGLELGDSNSPIASPLAVDNLNPGGDHPLDNPVELARLNAMGEVPYYRARGAKATAWIQSNPRRFAQLTAARIGYFWFPNFKRWPQALFAATVTLLTFLALWAAFRTGAGMVLRVFGSVLLVYPLPYYIVEADVRYRYPIYSLTLTLAAFWAVGVLPGRGGSTRNANQAL